MARKNFVWWSIPLSIVPFLLVWYLLVQTWIGQAYKVEWVLLILYLLVLIVARSAIQIFGTNNHNKTAWRLLIVVWSLVLVSAALMMTTNPDPPDYTCSMYHDQDFDVWWEQHNDKFPGITKEQFANFPFPNGFVYGATGKTVEPSNIQLGNIAVFNRTSAQRPIAHRIIALYEENGTNYVEVQGDNTAYSEEFPQEEIIGIKREHWLEQVLESDGCKE